MNRKHIGGAAAVIIATTAASPAAAQSGISVTVNGSPVAFTGQGPVEQGGRVLVPLRGVLEKLGAYVSYDAAARRVSAVRGQTSIVLPIGGSTATVGGRSVPLDSPAQVYNGATLVPLRFVAEALGERVAYEPASRTVAVSTSGGTSTIGSSVRPPVSGGNRPNLQTIEGTLVSADAVGRSITLRDAATGERQAYVLANNARIQLRRGGRTAATPLEMNDLRAGDIVAVTLAANGRARTVTVEPRDGGGEGSGNANDARPGDDNRVRGVIREITGTDGPNYTIIFQNGARVGVSDDARVMFRGSMVKRADLRPGDRVSVETDPATGRGREVELLQRAP